MTPTSAAKTRREAADAEQFALVLGRARGRPRCRRRRRARRTGSARPCRAAARAFVRVVPHLQQLGAELGGHGSLPAVSSRKTSSSVERLLHELVQRDAGLRPRARRSRRPTRRGRAGLVRRRPASPRSRPRASSPQQRVEPAARGRGRRPPCAPSARRASAIVTSRPRLMITTRSTVCATSASTWLETRTVLPPAANERRNVAQPADALGVEPVRGLVEDQQLRVAEQRRREPEPLAHAERVGARRGGAAASVEVDELQHLVHARVRETGREREREQVVAAGAPGMEVGRLEHRADPQRRPRELAVRLAEDERAAGRRARRARAASAASSSCRRRSGRGSP